MHKALQIDISDDKLVATMTILKDVLVKQKELTYPGLPHVLEACDKCKVSYGIDEKKIVDNLRFKDTPIVIAKGKHITPTVQDQIVYTFQDKRNHKFTPSLLADGKVNYYDYVKYKMTKPDEVLAFVRKGKAGENGINVYGDELVPDKYNEIPNEALKRIAGANTELTHNGIVATIAGIPMIDHSGKISVCETYTVKGDVDYSTGSIEFEGSIIVKGVVKYNLSIKTPHDVIIEGIVDGGIIEAGGMVTLLGGISNGTVKSGKILIAKYIYASEAHSDTTVIANEAILNSHVTAKTIISKGEPGVDKSGQIAGGKITANNFIWARNLGSPSSNYTEARIISNIDKKPLQDLQKEKFHLASEVNKFVRAINAMNEMRTTVANLPSDFKRNEYDLMQNLKKAEIKLKRVQENINKLEDDIKEEEETNERKIYVPIIIHPKVFLRIIRKNNLTRKEFGPSIIYISQKDGKFKIEPFKGDMILPEGYDIE